jgi:dinuclear metal center YbgI/SA1388 family protein
MIQVSDIMRALEDFAPLAYQESYDNSGLQVGNPYDEIKGVLLTLDITEAVVREAISRECNMVIAHHPLIFNGLKRITGRNYVERIVRLALKNDINLYAAHTNMDNVRGGVNAIIADRLNLQQTSILAPKSDNLLKLYTYAPEHLAEKVRNALFDAGAGTIGNYTECSFNTVGKGCFRPGTEARPEIGEAGGPRKWVNEVRIEVLVPAYRQNQVLTALSAVHTYEEVAYELISLENKNQDTGAGMIGSLREPMTGDNFLKFLKERMNTLCIRHTRLLPGTVERIAVCGGSGSFLLPDAIRAGADVLITGDFKYHQFFDAEDRILIADIGHYESEQFTVSIFADILRKKFPNFAPLLSTTSTNTINYYC